MTDIQFFITHWLPRPPEPGCWVPVAFLSQQNVGPGYPCYLGCEAFSPLLPEHVAEMEKSGEVRKLSTPQKVTGDRDLWIDSEGQVWFASEADPIGDPEKNPVARF